MLRGTIETLWVPIAHLRNRSALGWSHIPGLPDAELTNTGELAAAPLAPG
jgi:hypothetical protein